jgi:hypothetical protein
MRKTMDPCQMHVPTSKAKMCKTMGPCQLHILYTVYPLRVRRRNLVSFKKLFLTLYLYEICLTFLKRHSLCIVQFVFCFPKRCFEIMLGETEDASLSTILQLSSEQKEINLLAWNQLRFQIYINWTKIRNKHVLSIFGSN